MFNVKWIIFQLYHGENKLCLNDDDDDDNDDDDDDNDDDDDDDGGVSLLSMVRYILCCGEAAILILQSLVRSDSVEHATDRVPMCGKK